MKNDEIRCNECGQPLKEVVGRDGTHWECSSDHCNMINGSIKVRSALKQIKAAKRNFRKTLKNQGTGSK